MSSGLTLSFSTFARCKYSIVDLIPECPNNFCKCNISNPFSIKSVAKLCLNPCTVTFLFIPAFFFISLNAISGPDTVYLSFVC